jgi:hypothetical protein
MECNNVSDSHARVQWLALIWGEGLIGFWLYKENNKLRDSKNIFTLHIPPWAPHTYDFVILISLTHPWKKSFGCAANRKSQRLISTLRLHGNESSVFSEVVNNFLPLSELILFWRRVLLRGLHYLIPFNILLLDFWVPNMLITPIRNLPYWILIILSINDSRMNLISRAV